MKNEKIIKRRIAKRKLIETVVIPEHKERKVSKEFIQAKKQLKKDGNYKCWICGCTEKLHVHHFFCEWSLQEHCDYEKLKELVETFDIYGYGEKMKDIPITSVDDVRNMMVLCQEHHTGGITKDGSANGIHNLSFPIWISQKVSMDNNDPVPDNMEEILEIQKQIEDKYKED